MGETSLPSVNAWIHVRSSMPSRRASSSSARRWSMCECTPPYDTSPSRCTFPPRSRARRNADTSASFSKKEPSWIERLILWKSWSSTRPEPIVRCPTSEFPIWPAGSPTASPEAAIRVCGYSDQRRSKTGVLARSTALPGPGGAHPQPSRMTSVTSGNALPLRISPRTNRSRETRRRRARRRPRAGQAARRRCRTSPSRRTARDGRAAT